jgi:non-heme chloroperoxidase
LATENSKPKKNSDHVSGFMSSSKSIDVNGVTLSFVEKGTGQPVILIHGILSDYRAWPALMDALSTSYWTLSYSRRCSYPNQRKDYENSTVENNAEDLAQLLKAKIAAPAHLIGHSYGAFTALYCAYKNPKLVRSLVLVDPYVPSLIIKDPQNRGELFSLLLRKPSVALALRNFFNNSFNPALKALDQGLNERAVELLFAGMQGDPDAYSKCPEQVKSMMLANAGTMKEMTTKIPKFTAKEAQTIQTPTMLVSGENTHKVVSAIVEELTKSIPEIQVAKISNSAHVPHFENPEETNSAITKFLSEQTK